MFTRQGRPAVGHERVKSEDAVYIGEFLSRSCYPDVFQLPNDTLRYLINFNPFLKGCLHVRFCMCLTDSRVEDKLEPVISGCLGM